MKNLYGFYLVFVSILTLANPTLNSYYHSHRQDANGGLEQSILVHSKHFLNAEYMFDPLGDHGFEKPLIRSDKFDCVTFVDTILALSLASDASSFVNIWQQMRYQGQIDTPLERNHFSELHWLNNVKEWIQAVPSDTQASAIINLGGWYKQYCARNDIEVRVCKPYTQFKSQTVTLPYMPIEKWLSHDDTWQEKLPKLMVVMVVNKHPPSLVDKVGSDMLVSHMGFLYKTNGGLRLRHASSELMRVVDVDFIEYVRNHQNGSVIGYALFSINA